MIYKTLVSWLKDRHKKSQAKMSFIADVKAISRILDSIIPAFSTKCNPSEKVVLNKEFHIEFLTELSYSVLTVRNIAELAHLNLTEFLSIGSSRLIKEYKLLVDKVVKTTYVLQIHSSELFTNIELALNSKNQELVRFNVACRAFTDLENIMKEDLEGKFCGKAYTDGIWRLSFSLWAILYIHREIIAHSEDEDSLVKYNQMFQEGFKKLSKWKNSFNLVVETSFEENVSMIKFGDEFHVLEHRLSPAFTFSGGINGQA